MAPVAPLFYTEVVAAITRLGIATASTLENGGTRVTATFQVLLTLQSPKIGGVVAVIAARPRSGLKAWPVPRAFPAVVQRPTTKDEAVGTRPLRS